MSMVLRQAMVVVLPAMLLLLSACASGVTRSTEAALTKPALVGESQKAGQVTISLTPAAQQRAADNLKFDQNELLATIRRALEARNAITSEPDTSLPSVEIIVTDFRTRSEFSAVMPPARPEMSPAKVRVLPIWRERGRRPALPPDPASPAIGAG